MERFLDALWNPILAGLVLSAGMILLLGTFGLPLRRLGGALGGWARSRPAGATLLLATSASMTAVGAAIFAIEAAGPGALVWLWITTVGGLGLHFGEAKLAGLKASAASTQTQTEASSAPFAAEATPLGTPLAVWMSVGLIAVAIVAGGWWQGQQTSELFAITWHVPLMTGAIVVAASALLLGSVGQLWKPAVTWLPILGVLGFAGLSAAIALQDPFALQLALGDAVNDAFGLRTAAVGGASGGIVLFIVHGVMRAVTAADLGIGAAAAAATTQPNTGVSQPKPEQVAAGTSLVPLVVVAMVTTASALVVLTDTSTREPLSTAALVPLELHESRGLRPSRQVGQTIILPAETKLEKGNHYAMKLRANPRGHKMAKLLGKENTVILPHWDISEGTDRVIFRAREPQLAAQAGWDISIPCSREIFGGDEPTSQFVRLKPLDESVVFTDLITLYELDPEPYVDVDDFRFIGTVALANSPDESLGEHLAMFEHRDDTTGFAPKLHEFFRNGFRGPYPDFEGDVAPPWAFVTPEPMDEPIGAQLGVEMRTDPRGIAAVRLNRVGSAEGPPWASMMGVRTLILRHATDPAQDIRVAVAPRLDGHRIRFDALDPKWSDFRRKDTIAEAGTFTGPFALHPDVGLRVEVHGDSRLARDPEHPNAKRSTLVPLHPDAQPRGPQDRHTYEPHPAELLAAGLTGPFRVQASLATLPRQAEARFPGWGSTLLALAGLLLAVSTTVGWSVLVRQPAAHLLGESMAKPASIAVCLAPLLGAAAMGDAPGHALLLVYALAAIPTVLALILRLGDVRSPSA